MVVVRCLILCSKFAKKSFVCRGPLGSLKRSPGPRSWIVAKGGESGDGRARGEGRGRKEQGEGGKEKEGEGKGRGIPL